MNKKIRWIVSASITCLILLGLSCQDTKNPTVSITEPADGAEVADQVTISAQAEDNKGIAILDFYVDDSQIGDDGESPYEYTWDATAEVPGSAHAIFVVAYDDAGNEAWDSISVTVAQE
ncbi:hypothetical protein GF359_06120 [candidate division WOR-3 bacterium]|uniref:Uncharacterized protein n=1 Tax=candidate division WOR-3 bacterium TaxID=2052148 RepID=A0A9D5K9X7_UNCW3|nr:hypothetical protein [candidate division WOR-3 bacterium]MBD3364775.1 hypothetical protein [candidate division WOR-3 bacterium]